MRTLDQLSFSDKKVLIRVDFNVPLDANFQVTDDTRIRAAVPTIEKILSAGGAVILASHLGRPKGGPEDKYSLRHIVSAVSAALGRPVHFVGDCKGPEAEAAAAQLRAGEVLLLENVRFYPEEEKGDRAFAESLARLADIYVNDAFGTAHRRHASTAVIAEFFPEHKALGLLMEAEVKAISKVLKDAARPFVAVVGGAKVSSKMAILENLLEKVDTFIIGGGMVFTFIRAQGGQTGNSLVEEEMIGVAADLLTRCKQLGKKVYLPVDAVCSTQFSNDGPTQTFPTDAIPAGWMGLDIGPAALATFREVLLEAGTILWNGPMGVFEMSSFEAGTRGVAEAIGDATQEKNAYSLVGGGDSVAAVNQFQQVERVSYVSTGGGAMLEFMEGRVLPGVAAVLDVTAL